MFVIKSEHFIVSMAKCLVTGGAGFIGSHVADELLSAGHEVVILDDLSGGSLDNLPEKAQFIEGCITDISLVAQIFDTHHFDYVYHLAAYAAEGLSHFIKRFNYSNNLIGSINLLNESIKHDVKCFVFTSSIAVYGSAPLPMHERLTPMPEDPYGIAKYAFEQELKVSKEQFGLDYVIFRPHNVYGERQNLSDPYRNVIGIFINQLLQNKQLSIFGDGEQTRAFSYIDDIANTIAVAPNTAEARNHVFNIGSDTEVSLNNLAELIAQEFKVELNINYLTARNEVKHAYASHDKLHKVFDQTQETSLENGLRKMINWAKKQELRPYKRFEKIEIHKNLPPHWKNI